MLCGALRRELQDFIASPLPVAGCVLVSSEPLYFELDCHVLDVVVDCSPDHLSQT
jgi:hypothetical protein